MNASIRLAGAISACCLAAMVAVLVATLALRPFGILVPSSEEIVTFLMVGMAFFGFVYAYAGRAHVRVDTLHRRFPPRLRRAVEIASHAGAALLCAFVAYEGALLAWTAFRYNDLSDGLIPIPMWIPMSALPVGLSLFACALVRDGLRIAAGGSVTFAVSDKDEAVALAAARSAASAPGGPKRQHVPKRKARRLVQ
jgi:TRAP-type C4-dicarboxylate transport system permease small subunit